MNKSKKLLDNPLLGSLVVPFAVILVAALIVFGASKLLFSERSHKDLIRELKSKTFGNRWIAAYELSKYISRSQIPKEEIPELVDDLVGLYKTGLDPRSREFIIVTLGALKSPRALPLLSAVVQNERDTNILFKVIVALGNMDYNVSFDWSKLVPFLSSSDNGLKHAAILTLAQHRVSQAYPEIRALLGDKDQSIRHASAIALIHQKDREPLPVLKEILYLDEKRGYNIDQLGALKLNALNEIEKVKWQETKDLVLSSSQQEKDIKVKKRAEEVYNKLNN
jgi:HEAT repeat protein